MKHHATFLYCTHCQAEIKQHPEKYRAMRREHLDALKQYFTDNGDIHLLNPNGTIKNQRGNILPELLMLFFILFAVGTCSISTARKYDAKISRIINNSLELKDLNH